MNYTIRFRDDVFFEINDAYEWYEIQSKGLGELFLKGLDKCFENIRMNPFLFEMKYLKFRQALTKKFPYLVIFEVDGDNIIIYHDMHSSRNPKLKFKR